MDDEGELIDADYLLQQEYQAGYAKGWEDAMTSPVPAEREALQVSDEHIIGIAEYWFVTGENQHYPDGYRYRSVGVPSNVRDADLIAFARAILALRAAPAIDEYAGHYATADEVQVTTKPAPQEPELKKAYDQGYTQANLDAVDKGEMKW